MRFKITAMFKYCLSRQVAAALIINHSKDVLLNSKGEYMVNSIIRLVVEEESWERKKRAREDDEQEMMAKKRVEEFMRLKSSIQEKGGGGEQAGAEASPEEHASPEVLIEPAPQTPLDRLDVLINQNEQSSHEEDD